MPLDAAILDTSHIISAVIGGAITATVNFASSRITKHLELRRETRSKLVKLRRLIVRLREYVQELIPAPATDLTKEALSQLKDYHSLVSILDNESDLDSGRTILPIVFVSQIDQFIDLIRQLTDDIASIGAPEEKTYLGALESIHQTIDSIFKDGGKLIKAIEEMDV